MDLTPLYIFIHLIPKSLLLYLFLFWGFKGITNKIITFIVKYLQDEPPCFYVINGENFTQLAKIQTFYFKLPIIHMQVGKVCIYGVIGEKFPRSYVE